MIKLVASQLLSGEPAALTVTPSINIQGLSSDEAGGVGGQKGHGLGTVPRNPGTL